MKKLSTYLFLILFSFQTLSLADDISDFQIEGMSVGDSLLDYFSEKEIEDNIQRTSFKNKKYTKFEMYKHDSYKTYESAQVFFKKNDEKYKIYFVSGALFDENINIKNCKKKDEIAEEISKSIKDVKINDEGIYSHPTDKSGKSKVNASIFEFLSGGYIKVTCVDYSKKIEEEWGWKDNVRVDIGTEEFSNFLMYEAYE